MALYFRTRQPLQCSLFYLMKPKCAKHTYQCLSSLSNTAPNYIVTGRDEDCGDATNDDGGDSLTPGVPQALSRQGSPARRCCHPRMHHCWQPKTQGI